MTQNSTASRERILAAAADLFARNSYNGTSVDAVAQQAGVNKALIYYYFSGREEILHTLTQAAIDSVFRVREQVETLRPGDAGLRELIRSALRVLESERDTFRIMIVEALKSRNDNGALLSFLAAVTENSAQHLQAHDIKLENRHAFDLLLAFFLLIPTGMFMALGECWSEHMNYQHRQSEEIFSDAIGKMMATLNPEVVEQLTP
ncbi:MAG: helix-turn-helix domain-containing protein [Bacillota bacterium]